VRWDRRVLPALETGVDGLPFRAECCAPSGFQRQPELPPDRRDRETETGFRNEIWL
jgi:hypothetical protein